MSTGADYKHLFAYKHTSSGAVALVIQHDDRKLCWRYRGWDFTIDRPFRDFQNIDQFAEWVERINPDDIIKEYVS
ncbi:MAG: hypothetical protein GQ570_03625 [Helicobacteraceae bacterium]|nr:hypothetical protein [Helicobacteraceae bacterium]